MLKSDKSTFSEFFYKSAILSEELEKSLQREQKLLERCNHVLGEQLIKTAQQDSKGATVILNNWIDYAEKIALS